MKNPAASGLRASRRVQLRCDLDSVSDLDSDSVLSRILAFSA
jgi:hypothetical protein